MRATTTIERTLRAGPGQGRGTEGEYLWLVYGPGEPRVVRDDLEVTGIGWTYLYAEKKALISHHARVVFHSALPDFLK